jgi:catechol 2,3-dioxygenase-like lactoylglutathione lyase family enzyme
MESSVTKLLKTVENGNVDRRQLMKNLGMGAMAAFAYGLLPKNAAALAAQAAESAAPVPKVTPTTTVHHLSLRVPDYPKTRDWYIDLFNMRDVWDDGKGCFVQFGDEKYPNAFNIRPLPPGSAATCDVTDPKCKPGFNAPGADHIAFGEYDFSPEASRTMLAAMKYWGVTDIRPDSALGWNGTDPAGYHLNPWCALNNKALYPGSAVTCAVADSEVCKAGYEVGVKDLGSVPKPSGMGFKAIGFSHIILHVPQAELQKERDFYAGMYGMKVLSSRTDGPDASCVLAFGKNTLDLRPTANPDDKPYCNQYGFLIEDYHEGKVKAELERRNLNPTMDPKLGWAFTDLNGLQISIKGKHG